MFCFLSVCGVLHIILAGIGFLFALCLSVLSAVDRVIGVGKMQSGNNLSAYHMF